MEYPDTTKLYKYREFSSRTLTSLSNNELYFASSDSFNDPFDCRARKEFDFKDNDDFIHKWSILEAAQQNISIEKAKILVSEIANDTNKKEIYINNKSELFQKLVLRSFGICSFSYINNDILMWSHYSDSHKGLCLEFNRAPGNMLEQAVPVDYPKNDDFPYINYWLGPTDEQLDEFAKIIKTKSKHWDYEEEWRVIQAPPEKKEKYRGHPVIYPKEMLCGVIFGYRMEGKKRKTIKKILSSHTINYYEVKTVKNKFKLEIVPL